MESDFWHGLILSIWRLWRLLAAHPQLPSSSPCACDVIGSLYALQFLIRTIGLSIRACFCILLYCINSFRELQSNVTLLYVTQHWPRLKTSTSTWSHCVHTLKRSNRRTSRTCEKSWSQWCTLSAWSGPTQSTTTRRPESSFSCRRSATSLYCWSDQLTLFLINCWSLSYKIRNLWEIFLLSLASPPWIGTPV